MKCTTSANCSQLQSPCVQMSYLQLIEEKTTTRCKGHEQLGARCISTYKVQPSPPPLPKLHKGTQSALTITEARSAAVTNWYMSHPAAGTGSKIWLMSGKDSKLYQLLKLAGGLDMPLTLFLRAMHGCT